MDSAGGPGILPVRSRAGVALEVALGLCGGVTAALPWLLLSRCSRLVLTVGPHYPGYVVVVAGPGLTLPVVVPA